MANLSQMSARRSSRPITRFSICTLLSVVFGAVTLAAQAPPTIEAQLSKYGVPLTQGGLRTALRDPRPQVRSLAAGELAERQDVQSRPAIEQALRTESNLLVRFNLASALLELKSDSGNNVLTQICEDSSVAEDLRLQAISRLIDADDDHCLPQLVAILRNTKDTSSKISALLMLSKVEPVPNSLIRRIHPSLLSGLRDTNPAVREYTSQTIAAINDQAAAIPLRAAIEREPDRVIKDHMQHSLEVLERKRE